MPVFTLTTSVKFRDGGVKRFKDNAIPKIAKIIEKDIKYVTLDIKDNNIPNIKQGHHTTRCAVTYFDEFNKNILSQAGLELKRLLVVLFGEHDFFIRYSSYKNKVLIDWREGNEMIASTPIDNQGPRRNCWAFVATYITGSTYSMEHPSVKDPAQVRCSPQDISDWLYSFKEYNKDKDLDKYGTYGGNGMDAFQYIQLAGISLLKNYEIEKIDEDRYIETTFHETGFYDMLASKGDRIYIENYDSICPDTFLDNKPVYSIELVTKILHQGMAYSTVECCIHGCEHCEGLDNFNGEGVYDEPLHPENYKYQNHAVAVIGAGNLDGTDYLRIRNTRGPRWAKEGHADLHIKFFTNLIQVSGTNKKRVTKRGEKLVFTYPTD